MTYVKLPVIGLIDLKKKTPSLLFDSCVRVRLQYLFKFLEKSTYERGDHHINTADQQSSSSFQSGPHRVRVPIDCEVSVLLRVDVSPGLIESSFPNSK